MKINKLFFLLTGLSFLLTSCLSSMTPLKVNGILKEHTESQFLSEGEVKNLIEAEGCTYLVQGRLYTAPIGLTGKDDLKNAAKGIDEWVKADGGNSYVLKSYQWNNLHWKGANQLQVYFDTLKCN